MKHFLEPCRSGPVWQVNSGLPSHPRPHRPAGVRALSSCEAWGPLRLRIGCLGGGEHMRVHVSVHACTCTRGLGCPFFSRCSACSVFTQDDPGKGAVRRSDRRCRREHTAAASHHGTGVRPPDLRALGGPSRNCRVDATPVKKGLFSGAAVLLFWAVLSSPKRCSTVKCLPPRTGEGENRAQHLTGSHTSAWEAGFRDSRGRLVAVATAQGSRAHLQMKGVLV